MSSLRRSQLRRYRLFAPQFVRRGLILLVVLLLCDGIAALFVPQIKAGLSLAPAVNGQSLTIATPIVAAMGSQPVLASDDFKRSNQTNWGVAPDGQFWLADAQKTDSFSISEDKGIIKASAGFRCGVLGPVVTDSEVLFAASLSSYNQSDLGAILRWNNANDFYQVVLNGQGITLSRVVNGMETPLDIVPLTPRAGASYTFLFRAVGSQLSAMVWPTGQPAPANWQISLADSALTAGRAGIGAFMQAGTQVQVSNFKEVAS